MLLICETNMSLQKKKKKYLMHQIFVECVKNKCHLKSQKYMVVTMRKLSFTQRRRYGFFTIIDEET